MAHKVRQRIIDPLLYRLGYVHHDTTIQGVSVWSGNDPGTPVSGHLVFPGLGDGDPTVYVDFAGEIVDCAARLALLPRDDDFVL